MGYIVIENFKFGLDTRRESLTSKPGTLVDLINAHIDQGGQVEKRKAFTKTDIVSSIDPTVATKGFQEGVDGIYVFGHAADPGGWPTGIKYQRLVHPSLSVSDTATSSFANKTITSILYSTVFAGKIFVIAKFDNDNVFAFYDGTVLVDTYYGLKVSTVQGNTGLLHDLAIAINASGVYTASQPILTPTTLDIYGPEGSTYEVSVVETAAAGTLTAALVNTGIPGKQATQAIGSFQIIAGTEAAGHQITQVSVGVTNLLLAAVPFNDSVEQTASDVVVAINANSGTSGYSAVANQGTVIIYSVATGVGNNGKAVTVTSAVDVCIGQCVFALVGTGFSLDFVNANGTNLLSAVMNYPLIPGQTLSAFVTSVRDNINAGTATHGFLSAVNGNSLYLSKAVTTSTDAEIAVQLE